MFHGSMVALVTPMQPSGDIDLECFKRLIDWHIEQGSQALIIAGTTGEAATLSSQEKIALWELAVKHAHERIPIIAGSSANSTEQTIHLTQAAMDTGVDAALLMTPSYIKPTQTGLFQHYKIIAEQVAIPQILYNVPGRTACDLLPETLSRLAHISNIIGIKEATGDIERIKQIIKECGNKLDVYSGEDVSAAEAMFVGAKGVISVTANVVPKLMHNMMQAALDKNKEQAKELDQRLQPLHQVLFVESNPIPVKWALHLMGLIPEGIRLPLTPLSAHGQEQLIPVLGSLDLVN